VAYRGPARTGVGLAFAVQTGIYTQTVAMGAIALLVVAAVLAVRWPRRVPERLPFIMRAGAACVGVYVVLCAYPIYLLLAGPSRPQVTIRASAGTGADAANCDPLDVRWKSCVGAFQHRR